MIGLLTSDEIDRVLRSQQVGRLACAADDRPYIVPITYACSGAGHKIDVMRRQPNVCFLVDEIAGPSAWKSVVVHGAYEEILTDKDRRSALARLAPAGVGPMSRGLSDGNRVVVFRIRPSQISGRFERQDA
jgi:nitroimidazol reductase NimA-like FMN-containing flavoprotein (pyridoxamine 5'-phosphate oxidase superfamily)